MLVVYLKRFDSTGQGTFGCILNHGEFLGFTLEPPWKDNKVNESCIPAGEYNCVWHKSPRYGWCYMVIGVDGRSNILIHSGNYGGDTEKGLKTHTKGCILLGRKQGVLGKQKAILVSKPTVRSFWKRMEKKSFKLIIRG